MKEANIGREAREKQSGHEDPESPELGLDTAKLEVQECVDMVITLLTDRGVIPLPNTPVV